jgi:chromosome segregation ATPase
MKRWFKTRRQLLAELRNLERAVRDYQAKSAVALTALGELESKLDNLGSTLGELEKELSKKGLLDG